MMKYKIGDRVKVRSDLTSSKLYDGYGVVDKICFSFDFCRSRE